MRLLLDEMWSPEVTAQLRALGHDVEAIAARSDLRAKSDEFIFAFAQSEGRVVVTENANDFTVLASRAQTSGRPFYGVILTSPRRYSRRDAGSIGRLVRALDTLLRENPSLDGLQYWLP